MISIKDLFKEYDESYESKGMILDAEVLYNFIVERKLSKVLELGVLHGSTTRALALAVSQLESGSLTSVDIEEQCLKEVRLKLESDGTLNKVNLICSDSINFLAKQEFNTWDVIFIDTDHTLKQTLAEIFLSGLAIKQYNGHIFLHDVHMQEVSAAINIFNSYNNGLCSITGFKTESGLVLIQMEKK